MPPTGHEAELEAQAAKLEAKAATLEAMEAGTGGGCSRRVELWMEVVRGHSRSVLPIIVHGLCSLGLAGLSRLRLSSFGDVHLRLSRLSIWWFERLDLGVFWCGFSGNCL
jgi:hypothetical protein